MKKKVLVAVGGTGGHIYPAQALAEQLLRDKDKIEVLFVGGDLKSNPYFDHNAFASESIDCAKLDKSHIIRTLMNGGKAIKGVFQAIRIIKNFKPDLVVGFGSYHTFPLLTAASLLSVPFVLHESNAIPGKVNKLFSKRAISTGVQFSETCHYLKGKSLEVNMPLRAGYAKNFGSLIKAREYFGLDPDKVTFLVFGGSQGALAINTHFCGAMIELTQKTSNFQIIHLTGDPVVSREVKKVYDSLDILSCTREFESKMDLAYQAADLAISRAGASTIAELIEYELPSILIPYPFATDDHQTKNATIMEQRVKGSVILPQDKLGAESLSKLIFGFFKHERAKLEELQANIRHFKNKQLGKDFKTMICELVGVARR